MIAEKAVEPVPTKSEAPIVFTNMNDGSTRFYADNPELNAVSISDPYPFPRMDEHHDDLVEVTVFATLDAKLAYWQIEIDWCDLDEAAFTSHYGLYRLTRTLFRLKNTPGLFRRAVDVVLVSLHWPFVVTYLEDIVVLSRSPLDHIEHIRRVLRLLYKASASPNLKKCKLFAETVGHLGHVARHGPWN